MPTPDTRQEIRHYRIGGNLMIAAATVHGTMWVATRNGWFFFGFWLFAGLLIVFSVLEANAKVRLIKREQLNRET